MVEDEPDVAEVLATMLGRSGYRVDVAHTGEQAMKALAETSYDALTLDLMLPDISGLEIIRRVRQQPDTAALPIFVVSAKMEEGRLAINGDFSGIEWLAKPVDEARMLERIDALLGTSLSGYPHVLHVEDDGDLHQVIRNMAGERFDIDLARSVREARERVALKRFDVVILDLGLLDGSGWDLLPEIRKHQPETRVLILSGTDMTAEEAQKVEGVLLKSRVSAHELLEALGSRIHRETPRSET
ncbi:response regulator [Guyparkeria sp. 1SP6A2]|nr:response regulator [Guyparkeria sp. 1SP6A2]